MMNFPKISIIVPSYNQGQFLEETLQSVINQHYPNLELFVIDGASTDGSVEIIKKHRDHISWWVSERDSGQSEAINKGLSKATGDIITWLNSDDLFTPDTLLRTARQFSKLPDNTGLIHGGTILFNDKKELKADWGYENSSLERNMAGMAFPQPSVFFLKKYLDRIGGKVNEKLHYGMDYDLYSRLACICRFSPVKDIFSKYRLHDNSKSVAEQHKFSTDWSKTYVNTCKNLGWSNILDEIYASDFFDDAAKGWFTKFSFEPDSSIVNKTDREKTLYYHYCYILKALYWNGQHDKSRELIKMLKKKYPAGWLAAEKDVSAILKKLALPGFVLQTLKMIKKLK